MKNRFVLILIASVLFPLDIYSQIPNPTQPQRKIALVIGNGNYTTSVLTNPENDAKAMADVLKKLGFIVYEYENLNQSQLKKAIDDFGTKLKGNDIGLFYYAGHGIQAKGNNYLIPVDADLKTEEQVEYDCVRADRVLSLMETSGTKVNIIILDACRNNPFDRRWRTSSSNGLISMDAPFGTLIAYSTAPGRTASDGSGNNSPYTSALLESLIIPDLSISQIFQKVAKIVSQKSNMQQVPWIGSSLTDDFYFNRSESIPGNDPIVGLAKEVITYGSIELTTEISGELYLDGYRIANIISNTIIPINDVTTGGHKLEIVGIENWTENIIVKKGEILRVRARSSNSDNMFKLVNSGEFVDKRDDKKYKWIKIGSQTWMAENLKTTKFNDGTPIPYVPGNSVWSSLTTPGYCWYNHNELTYGNTYGAIYNWYAVNTGKLCPIGWHVPTDDEWSILTSYLGGEKIAGGKLKETGVIHWDSPNTDATNEASFTGLPGGWRLFTDGEFVNIKVNGNWWSATGDKLTYSAWCRGLWSESGTVDKSQTSTESGFSVRCLKNY